MKVNLLGMGGGTCDTLTVQAREILAVSHAVIGPPRLLAALPPEWEGERHPATATEDILARLQTLRCSQVAVVFSGDSGF